MDDGVHTDHKAGVICLCGYSPDAEITTLRARVRELEEHMALSGTPSTSNEPPSPRDAVVEAAVEYERLWIKVQETDTASVDDRVELGRAREHLSATVRALRAAEGRG
ncbi:MAG TPA: hypothetical protein DCQ64_26185 [Candidatus Rokubacteria bacterium]|nr:hypothetical protein [Candidatus Rokubacteria bacterium]